MSQNLISGAQLAKQLKVAPATLSRAVRKNYKVNGVSVANRAVMGDNDKIKGYKPLNDVPNSLSDSRANPSKPQAKANKPKAVTSESSSFGEQLLAGALIVGFAHVLAPKIGDWIERMTTPSHSNRISSGS